jgi:hypothetical protein
VAYAIRSWLQYGVGIRFRSSDLHFIAYGWSMIVPGDLYNCGRWYIGCSIDC